MALKKQYLQLKNRLYLEGAFSFANFTLLNGIFLVGFALALGANTFQLGVLIAIPLFANLMQLVSAFILEMTGTKKYTTLISLLFGRLSWVLIILIAFGVFRKGGLVVLGAVLLLSSIFTAVGNLSLLSWMKDIVPVKKLASFWGKRNIYASVGGVAVYLAGSILIDRYTNLTVFGYIYILAILFGMVGLATLIRIPEKKKKIIAINPGKFIKRLSLPFYDAKFRPLIYFGLLWGFAINFSSPFFLVFMLDDLSIGFFMVSVFLVIDSIARIYGLSVWRRIADRFGARPLLVVSGTVTTAVPLLFVFLNKGNFFFIPFIFIMSAISYAAVDIAIGQILFKSAPRKYDAYYLSTFTSLTGLSSALGPVLGGLLAVIVKNNSEIIYLGLISPLKYVFLVSFCLRVLCLPLISKINEPKAKNVDDILEKIRTLRSVSFFVTLYSITDYTSKIVLVPQKQLFFLQRKTVEMAKKDLTKIMAVLSKISATLNSVPARILPRHEKKITELTDILNKQVDKLDYMEGRELHNIPKRVLTKMESLESSIDGEEGKKIIKEKVESAQKSVETEQEKLDRVYNKEIV